MDSKLNMNQQWALLTNKVNGVLGFIRQSTDSRWKEMILLHSDLECWVQFWTPQYRRDMDILEGAPQKAMKMMD